MESVPTLHVCHIMQSAGFGFQDGLFYFLFTFVNAMMAVLLQEYTLAHIDKPDTLDGAEKALKKHEDFVSTMEANEDKIDGALQGGQRLVDSNNLYSGKVQEKMDSIGDRYVITVSDQFWPVKWCPSSRVVERKTFDNVVL